MLAALNPADITAIESGLIRQPLLRHTQFAPLGADALA